MAATHFDRKADPSDVRAANRLLMFDLLFPENRMSRAELGRSTGLSRVAASEAVADMLDKHILRETGTDERAGRGKRGVLLAIDPDVWRVVTLDLSQAYVLRGALVNLCGRIVTRLETPLDSPDQVDLDDVIDMVRRLLALAGDHVLGVGVSIPGVVTREGRVVLSSSLGWHDVELRDLLEGEFGLPTRVCNDANTAMLAERFLGSGTPNSMFVRITRGIGAAVLVGDQLVYGEGYAAGEIGHVVADPNGPECSCGKRGCLEALISASALRERIAQAPDKRREILERAGELLGQTLATSVSLLDVTDVAVYGPADIVGDAMIEGAQREIDQLTASIYQPPAHIRRCEQGDDIVLCGQAMSIIQARVSRL